MNEKNFVSLVALLISTNVFADVPEYLNANAVVNGACVVENTGVYETGFTMVPVYEDTIYTCPSGQYLPQSSETCATCTANHYCPGGDYTYSTTENRGLNACTDMTINNNTWQTYSPTGMSSLDQCGRKFKVELGDGLYLYLRRSRRTTPSFVVNIDGTKFYANMVKDTPVPMSAEFANRETLNKMTVNVPENTTGANSEPIATGKYYVYDDTIDPTDYDND